MIHGTDLPADLDNLRLVSDWTEALGGRVLIVEVERWLESLEDAPAKGVFVGLPIVQEVGRREEAGNRLDPARGLLDRILGFAIPEVSGQALHQGKVSAGRASGDANS